MAKGNILFIDDDNFLRKVYQSELSEKGFSVSLAADGVEGLSKMKSEKPDLVILDLIMPKKSGFELLADVRDIPEVNSIPIIVLSNLAQSEDQERALGLGAIDYLIKDSTTLDIIADKITYHLRSGMSRSSHKPGPAPSQLKRAEERAAPKPETKLTERKADGAVSSKRDARGHNFCPQCGFPVKEHAQFCPDCGMKLI